MDPVAIAQVLQGRDVVAIAVVVCISTIPVVKGAFTWRAGRNQRRKEFLEFWKEGELGRDDLWLEEVMQHRYGVSMPAPLIRHVGKLSWPSRKLRMVSFTSKFFELDEIQGKIVWSVPRRARPRWLEAEMVCSLIAYVVLAMIGAILIITSIQQNSFSGVTLGVCGIASGCAAIKAFWHFISLVEARSTMVFVNEVPRPGLWTLLMRKVAQWIGNQRLGTRRVKQVASTSSAESVPLWVEGD